MNVQRKNLPARPIDDLPRDRFLRGWTAIVGEPPSIMLDRYRQMIEVLVTTVPAASDEDCAFRGSAGATKRRQPFLNRLRGRRRER